MSANVSLSSICHSEYSRRFSVIRACVTLSLMSISAKGSAIMSMLLTEMLGLSRSGVGNSRPQRPVSCRF